MKYTCILFDADDTLMDFGATERSALLDLFSSLELEPTDVSLELYRRINNSWWNRLESGQATFDQLIIGRIADFLAAAGINADAAATAENMVHYLGKYSYLLDGAKELLERIHPFCRLYIITNGISRVQRSRMELSGIKHCFSDIFISQEIGSMKPSQEFFDHVLSRLENTDRSEILVVGDSLNSDIRGGNNAGLDTCWLNPLGRECGSVRPTYTVQSLSEAGDIILGS